MPDSPESLVIRTMQMDDAERAAELCQQLGYERMPAQIRAWLQDSAAVESARAAFVACVGEAIAGWIEVSVQHHLQSDPFALIGGLVVDERFRSRNIGRRLCERVEIWAEERGIETVRVTSRSTRLDAHRFYLRDGYRQVKISMVFEKKRSQKKHGK